jgi:two-component system, OmpR family, KDP operon response regulator KdpE
LAIKVLIVDDDSAIRRVLTTTLRAVGFEVVESSRGDEAISLIGITSFDAVLLDMNMPSMGGIAVCRAIRKVTADVPILMLTVRNAEDDKVHALDAGADDYVTKPFAIRELIARINAVVRRAQKPVAVDTMVAVHDVSLDGERRLFTKRGEQLHLTKTQFDIVELLMRSPGRAISHRKILTEVWGAEYRDHVEYLRTYMRQLRKIIEDDPAHPQYLLTVPYVGYCFREAGPTVASPEAEQAEAANGLLNTPDAEAACECGDSLLRDLGHRCFDIRDFEGIGTS